MDPHIIIQLRDKHAEHKSVEGTRGREETRSDCLRLLEMLEAQAQGEAGSLAASLASNRAERIEHRDRLDAMLRALAHLDGLEVRARSQARMSLLFDLPVGVLALAAGAVSIGAERPKFGVFAAMGVVAVAQGFGPTQPLTESVSAVLAELAAGDMLTALGEARVPLEKWRPTYVWGVSPRRGRLIAEAIPELRSKLRALVAKRTEKIDESLASSVRLLVLFGPEIAGS